MTTRKTEVKTLNILNYLLYMGPKVNFTKKSNWKLSIEVKTLNILNYLLFIGPKVNFTKKSNWKCQFLHVILIETYRVISGVWSKLIQLFCVQLSCTVFFQYSLKFFIFLWYYNGQKNPWNFFLLKSISETQKCVYVYFFSNSRIL